MAPKSNATVTGAFIGRSIRSSSNGGLPGDERQPPQIAIAYTRSFRRELSVAAEDDALPVGGPFSVGGVVRALLVGQRLRRPPALNVDDDQPSIGLLINLPKHDLLAI